MEKTRPPKRVASRTRRTYATTVRVSILAVPDPIPWLGDDNHLACWSKPQMRLENFHMR